MLDNPAHTRRCLAAAQAARAADPTNPELALAVFRLQNLLECLDWPGEMNRLLARLTRVAASIRRQRWLALTLDAIKRRN